MTKKSARAVCLRAVYTHTHPTPGLRAIFIFILLCINYAGKKRVGGRRGRPGHNGMWTGWRIRVGTMSYRRWKNALTLIWRTPFIYIGLHEYYSLYSLGEVKNEQKENTGLPNQYIFPFCIERLVIFCSHRLIRKPQRDMQYGITMLPWGL